MPRQVVIVESKTKAEEIAHILRADGHTDFTTKATFGHIMDLPSNELGVEYHPNEKNEIRFVLRPLEKKGPLIADLKKLCKGADVIVASDPDREGEAIAWHVMKELGRLPSSMTRAEFHAITASEIRKALKNTRNLNFERIGAQTARRIIDRLFGYVLSPLAADAMGVNYSDASVGRVQSALLKILYDREKEILGFVPEPFWKIILEDDKGTKFASKPIKVEAEAEEALKALRQAPVTVLDVKSERKSESAPKPLTSSSMQQYAFKRFKWGSDRTMRVAQDLFEAGRISYHRTDSVRFAPETTDALRAYIQSVAPAALPAKAAVHRNTNRVQDAHEAIHPTDMTASGTPQALSGKLQDDHAKLYDLIWTVAVASQAMPAQWDVTTVVVGNGNTAVILGAQGKRLAVPGFRTFLPSDEKTLAPYSKQDLIIGEPNVNKEFTKPPARYNAGTVVKAMETNGIGRPSTYAPTVAVLLHRCYVMEEKDAFRVTPKGMKLIDWLTEICPEIVNVSYTADMESRLDSVELGEAPWEDPVKESLAILNQAKGRLSSVAPGAYRLTAEDLSASRTAARKTGTGNFRKPSRSTSRGGRGYSRGGR
jgi:DNA topoisomerase-1